MNLRIGGGFFLIIMNIGKNSMKEYESEQNRTEKFMKVILN